MAGLLLCALTVCTPLLGCLIPQDDQVIAALPPKRNSPPRIVGQAPPTPRTTYYSSSGCPNKTFSLTVEDEDTGDTLRSLWFIDVSPSALPYAPTKTPPNGSKQRAVGAPTSLSFTNALSNLASGTHLLTAYVADSEFDEVSNGVINVTRPPVVLPTGETVTDDGYIDSFTWVLDVEPCP